MYPISRLSQGELGVTFGSSWAITPPSAVFALVDLAALRGDCGYRIRPARSSSRIAMVWSTIALEDSSITDKASGIVAGIFFLVRRRGTALQEVQPRVVIDKRLLIGSIDNRYRR